MPMQKGWIKFHRCVLDNPVICKDAEHFYLWSYLLLSANHSEKDVLFSGKRTTLKPGQLITGRKSIAKNLGIEESKVQRILKAFEDEQQIEQRTSNSNRLISIVRWKDYQENEQQNEQRVNSCFDGCGEVPNENLPKSEQQNEQQNEQQKNSLNGCGAIDSEDCILMNDQQNDQQNEQRMNNERTTDEQRVNTNNNVNTDKNDIKKNIDDFFESVWKLYPVKKGKASVSPSQKKKLYSLGYDTIKTCIDRYTNSKEQWRAFKDGSTFFNSGYVDYLDENYQEQQPKTNKVDNSDNPLIRTMMLQRMREMENV